LLYKHIHGKPNIILERNDFLPDFTKVFSLKIGGLTQKKSTRKKHFTFLK